MPKNRIHKFKDGRYSYSVSDSKGKRHQLKSRKGETLTAFKKRCNALDKMAEQEIRTETFDDLFKRWIDEHVRPNLSAGELKMVSHRYELHVQPEIGHKRIAEIKRDDIYSLLVKMQNKGLSASMIRLVRGCISRPYNWAVNTLGMDITPPTQGLVFRPKTKTKEKRSRVISDEDMARFHEAAKSSKYARYFKLLELTGLRPSEALGLQVRDIKDESLEIHRAVTRYGQSSLKTENAARSIPMTPEIKNILKEQLAHVGASYPGWLFPAASGTPDMDSVQSSFTQAKKRTAIYKRGGHNGLKKLALLTPPIQMSLYDFRHTFATRLAEAGCNEKALQMIMGHSSISITLQYYIGLTDQIIEETKYLMQEVSK